MRALILAGAPLDVPDAVFMGEMTALRGAGRNPDREVLRILVEAGARE